MTQRKFFMSSGALALPFLPLLASAQASQPWPAWSGPGPWHMMWGDGGWGFWWIFPLLMFGVMVFLCAYVIMRAPWGRSDPHFDTTASALRVLNERFAQGAIGKDEYEEKKAILSRRA